MTVWRNCAGPADSFALAARYLLAPKVRLSTPRLYDGAGLGFGAVFSARSEPILPLATADEPAGPALAFYLEGYYVQPARVLTGFLAPSSVCHGPDVYGAAVILWLSRR